MLDAHGKVPSQAWIVRALQFVTFIKPFSDQPFDFYARNNICEVGFGKEVAAKVLGASGLVVAAFEGDRLVGIARATFDGLTAAVMEMSLACELQGKDLVHQNGSLIENLLNN